MKIENPPPVEVFIKTSESLVKTTFQLFAEKKKLPGLIMFYSSLDIFASITRPKDQADTNGAIFQTWINDYMLPFPPLRCNAMDLWGARCGLLHTFTTESKKSRDGQARELGYIDDDAAADELQKVDPTGVHHVVIGLPSLMRAYLEALKKFGTRLQNDANLRDIAEHHLKSFILAEGLTTEELEAIKQKFK